MGSSPKLRTTIRSWQPAVPSTLVLDRWTVPPRSRSEQQRTLVTEAQPQAGEESSSAVVEALLAHADRFDVAPSVEDGERLAVLQDAVALVRRRAGGKDVVAAVDL